MLGLSFYSIFASDHLIIIAHQSMKTSQTNTFKYLQYVNYFMMEKFQMYIMYVGSSFFSYQLINLLFFPHCCVAVACCLHHYGH